jgi:hypothetical protein
MRSLSCITETTGGMTSFKPPKYIMSAASKAIELHYENYWRQDERQALKPPIPCALVD